MKKTEISTFRKALYYGGNLLTIIGILLFLSTFLISFDVALTDRFDNFMFRPVLGMICTIVGQVIANVGKAGLAGSGVVLDPKQARKDLEPYSRQVGGMISDGLEEVSSTIKVRCRNCQTLNDEAAKFCDECGQPL
ncbi:MAG: zinc ribbon domain-containing protein [Erysipelothrix sp.]|nr:zinc ribbon domain-containing protein [Erysipelothrix sp.]